MYTSNKAIAESFLFKFFYEVVYELLLLYHSYEIVNPQKLNKVHNRSCIYIGRHSTHNYELFGGIMTMYRYSNKLVRGIGHYLMYVMCPHFYVLGAVIGTNKNVEELLQHGEDIFINVGGAEELTFGGDMSHICHWETMSQRYRTGFARLSAKHCTPVIPVASGDIEGLVYAPFVIIARMFNIPVMYDRLMKLVYGYKKIYKILFIIKIWFSALFGLILVIPMPHHVRLHIGDPLFIRYDETVLEFAKRCEHELNKMNAKLKSKILKAD